MITGEARTTAANVLQVFLNHAMDQNGEHIGSAATRVLIAEVQ
jgi:hypothetical protein